MLSTVIKSVVFCCLNKRKRLGFTFMELVFVLCAVVALSGGAFIVTNNILQSSRYNTAKSNIAIISLAVSRYRFEVGTLPSALEDLSVAVGQYGPWLDTETLTDPWGNEYNFSPTANNTFAVWSYGPNRDNDSEDVPVEFLEDDIGLFGH